MKRYHAIALLAIMIIVIVTASLFFYAPTSQPTIESITIGHVPMESFALLYVAENQHYFQQNNLNVTIIDYPTGPLALDALINGEVDVAGSSDYAFAKNAVDRQNISLFTAVGGSELIDLVAPNNTGITKPSDLKDKTIGVALDTAAEYDLAKFLEANDIKMDQVNIVNVLPTQYVDAIVNGSVDALVSWEPYTDQISMAFQGRNICWSINTNATAYSVLSSRNNWIETHNDTMNRLLVALSQAQDYMDNNTAEAQQIIKARFNYTDSYLATVWSRCQFSLSLKQSMISTMQDETAWLVNNSLTDQKTAPTIRDYIFFDCLNKIRPQAVD